MASYNKVILMGHLTRDPVAGQLPSGTAVCEFGLAVNRRWKDAQGEPRDEALFIDCVSFGKTAETLAKHFKKGKPIHIEGHLKLETWAAQDGSKRSKIRVVVEQFRCVEAGHGGGGEKPSNGEATQPPKKTTRGKRRTPPPAGGLVPAGGPAEEAPKEEDIPF